MTDQPLRTLLCYGNNQNFFDLPCAEIGPVWEATQALLSQLKGLDGLEIIGTFDDDAHMVGPPRAGRGRSTSWQTPVVRLSCRRPAGCCAASWSESTPCGATSRSKHGWGAS